MEQILFGKNTRINITTSATTIKAYIDGTIPMPDTYFIGKNCKLNHGQGDKGVRYVRGRKCIACILIAQQKHRNQKSDHEKQHKIAMDKIEEQAMLKELGLDGGLDSDIEVG